MKIQIKDFIPQSITCLRAGYSKTVFFHDVFAGVSVGVIALPLAIAFAIASGVLPEQGLFTAIIAGFLISLLGGSRVQIGGPTGAFVVVVYAIVQKHGYDGLALATLVASVMLVIMGLARFGILLKFIPYPVTTGFTTGIAFVIAWSQVPHIFGLQLKDVPHRFLEQCQVFCAEAYSWNPWAAAIAFSTAAILAILRRFYPKLPGAIIAIVLTTWIAYAFKLPVETIQSKFGEIPRSLPQPALPHFSWELFKTTFPDAISIALLGAIESLLSATVADGMTGHRHRSNLELIAQGIANMGSVIFKGIPATGAIARTSANIKLGAQTPVSGMVHAITLLALMFFLTPLAGLIPLAALGGILLVVAWHMAEIPHFFEILKGRKGDAIVLITTFFLTIFIDLTVAVQVGMILAAVIFLKRMTDTTTLKICQTLVKENENETPPPHDSDILLREDIPNDTVVFELTGPFFYPVADLLDETLQRLPEKPRVFLLRMHQSPLVDATGLKALKQFAAKCHRQDILFLISEIKPEEHRWLTQAIQNEVGKEHLFPSFEQALSYARSSA